VGPNWDDRYADKAYAYGEEPNAFFASQLANFEPGNILMPADGEGRNGVFAATQGWKVTAADLSVEGKKKALALARSKSVELDYHVGQFQELEFEKESFDAVGLIYAHFPASIKSQIHRQIDAYIKPGGIVIFEAFSKSHLELRKKDPQVGGPMDIDMLFSTDETISDFDNYDIIYLQEETVNLAEGLFHNGESSVVRFVGRKYRKQLTD